MNLSQAEEYSQKYYDELIWQTVLARAHLKLWERLGSFKSDYLKELNQAPHFFNLTLKAHFDDALLTLSRILDKRSRGDPLTIWKFLNFAKQNRIIFSTQAFRQRMMQKPDYNEYWTKSHTPITLRGIEEDRQKLGGLEETIDNVMKWRDKVIAHTDRQFLLTGKIISKEYPLRRQQLQEVIDTLVEILNRYSGAFNSSTFLEKFVGEDDVQNVMGSIRFNVQERKKRLEEIRRQAHNKG